MNLVTKQYKLNSEETPETPLLNDNYKKLPKHNTYQDKSKSTKKNYFSYIVSSCLYVYYSLLKLFSKCCISSINTEDNEKIEEHICYFSNLEDRITIEPNYLYNNKGLPYIFWGEKNEEDVFFDEDEQIIINKMKESIKKYM